MSKPKVVREITGLNKALTLQNMAVISNCLNSSIKKRTRKNLQANRNMQMRVSLASLIQGMLMVSWRKVSQVSA